MHDRNSRSCTRLTEKFLYYLIKSLSRGSDGFRSWFIGILVLAERLSRLREKGCRNIVLKERYGKDNRALLKCKTCGHCFSETHGTPFFGLNTSMDEVCRTLAQIPEKGSIRGASRSSGHDKSTICRWIDLAGKHCKEVTDYFLKELHPGSRSSWWDLVIYKKRRETSQSTIWKNTVISIVWLQLNRILDFF